ncbi:four helix bundle protein [bacterium]|nr:four helix bundle protein [bacterium]MCB1222180.1 four helix bundle protein [bacterium]UNM10089.1 MAG: four helix bundle protein [Planctomycetales bacterium]
MGSAYHRDLRVWQRSMDLVERIYELSNSFPKQETYGITSQLRRAAVSIPTNIAEGNGRSTRRDYAHFLSIAFGSAREVDTLLDLATRLRVAEAGKVHECLVLLDEVCGMLYAMRSKLVAN